MRIIQEGDLRKLNKTKMFICNLCGCVFEADKNEYETGSQYNETYYYCKCPTCGHSASETIKCRR